jgi:hypothetical protein
MHTLELPMPADPTRSAVRLLDRLTRQAGGRTVLRAHGASVRSACAGVQAARRGCRPDEVAAAEARLRRAVQLAHLSLLTPRTGVR